ncbi:SH3 domain-containing protein [Archangium sp.]|uniref:SH3 domain-containing protein n=1 Tax=Archangium sp. TaxID=1872627 RepID=UPI00286CC7CF|nr:SH3 domain-containing protein [Archangium sp.]
MKNPGVRSLLPFLLASALTACGPELDESSPVSAGELETNTAAVISGASRGSTVQVSATDGVNVRSGPGSTYGLLVTVPYGKTATVLNATPTNGFYQVDYQGTVGWTHGDYWNVVAGLWVNGYQLNATQEKWVRWMGTYTVPKLQGTRDERLTKAARVAWWSLKEGVLDLANPFSYSNCNYTTGDAHVGPLVVCPSGRAWQVGISGVQVPNFSMATVQNTSASIHSTLTEAQVLGATASQAGYASGTSTYNSIVNSTGDLRKSWLQRNHAVGITLQETTVTYECVTNSYGWCYGTAWPTTARYAPNRTEALESIRELKAAMDGLAP